MKLHANAPLGPKGRATMVSRVLEEGLTLTEAAAAAGVSVRTAGKWVRRYRAYLRLENTPSNDVRGPQAVVFGTYVGEEKRLAPLLEQLTGAVGAPAASSEVEWKSWLEAVTVGLGNPDDHLYSVCDRTPTGRSTTR